MADAKAEMRSFCSSRCCGLWLRPVVGFAEAKAAARGRCSPATDAAGPAPEEEDEEEEAEAAVVPLSYVSFAALSPWLSSSIVMPLFRPTPRPIFRRLGGSVLEAEVPAPGVLALSFERFCGWWSWLCKTVCVCVCGLDW